MKVQAVSLAFKNNKFQDKAEYIYPFLYSGTIPQSDKQLKGFGITTAALAFSAVCVTLFNLKRRKKFPRDIVELPNVEKGLNKLKDFRTTIADVKSKFIYPLRSAVLGEERVKHFKSGLIFINENSEQTKNFMSAFTEHLNELEINVLNIGNSSKRNELVKEVFNKVQYAEQLYKDKGKYTVINLGDLEKLTSLKAVKSQKSKIEQLLEDISSGDYKGVLWTARSNNIEALPLFFNNLPVMITKLVD